MGRSFEESGAAKVASSGGTGVDWAGAKRIHAALSPEAVAFLDFAEREPRCLDAASFEILEVENPSRKYSPQPWPTLVAPDLIQHFSRVNASLAALVRSVPGRVLGNDPQRIADAYGLQPERAALVAQVLENTAYRNTLIGRGDFVFGPSGFHCVEYNLAGSIGGFEIGLWEDLFRRVPVLRRFFDEEGVRFTIGRSVASLWTHLWRQARRRGRGEDGSFNVAITVPPGEEITAATQGFVNRELQRVLAERQPGTEGEVVFCDFADLELGSHGPRLGGRRIHAIVSHGATLTRDVFFAWMDGEVDLYNGVLDRAVLPDKRTLGLLSEAAEAGVLDEEECRLVRDHVPWTRRLAAVEAEFRGEKASLPDIVRATREELVLKPALGWGGKGVQLGAFATPERWDRLVDEALESGDWVVQERVRSLPFLYHDGAGGCAPHDVAWGLFHWSDPSFHGGYVRMLADSEGVVNVGRGAKTGLIFVVEGKPGA